MIKVYCDGGVKPANRKDRDSHGTYGVIAFDDGKEIYREADYIGNYCSNNIAEYTAILKAVEWLDRMSMNALIVTDSLLAVNQINGKWQCHDEVLRGFQQKIKKLMKGNSIRWIPREENLADELTRIEYEQIYGNKKPKSPERKIKVVKKDEMSFPKISEISPEIIKTLSEKLDLYKWFNLVDGDASERGRSVTWVKNYFMEVLAQPTHVDCPRCGLCIITKWLNEYREYIINDKSIKESRKTW